MISIRSSGGWRPARETFLELQGMMDLARWKWVSTLRPPYGAGHFVKMVHNGIEYGVMVAYSEGLGILRQANIGRQQSIVDAETTPLRHPEHYPSTWGRLQVDQNVLLEDGWHYPVLRSSNVGSAEVHAV